MRSQNKTALFARLTIALAPLLIAIVAAMALADAPNVSGSPEVRVSTFSGSGALGTQNGGAAEASYVAPFGIAVDRMGRTYVSDAGAQRIRVIERNGSVRTLAGSGSLERGALWVRGGYADGPGNRARFDRPAGIALGADGALYVADTNNHCIRRVDTTSGNVSTFAGSTVAGHADGPRLAATFDRPTGLAQDSAGILYVADYFGIRMIARDGSVSTIPNFGNTPFGVAVASSPGGTVIFVADLLGIARRAPDGAVERIATAGGTGTRYLQGAAELGYPFGISAFDDHSVAFSDPRSNTVNYLNWTAGALQVLGGAPAADGAASAAGFSDGSGTQSRFDAPLGVLAWPDGTVLVADSANRRIRRISGLDRAHDALPGGEPKLGQSGFKIVFVGNSFLWEYTRWSDSIQGMVEAALKRRLRRSDIVVNPYLFPGAGFGADLDYIDFLARAGGANLVILNINENSVAAAGAFDEVEQSPESWRPQMISALRRMNATLKALHIGFLVYTTPLGRNISPSETVLARLLSAAGQQVPNAQFNSALNDAVQASGAPLLNLFPAFDDALRARVHPALFGSFDEHFSYAGRVLVAKEITDAILRRRLIPAQR
ncbi:MAG: hypothetical protein JO135_10385 [Candidatus Eremiobacteraeota bacterium]|nr:hypothetical protein [Candidatus Eremiobacteraeota bacterium]